MVHLVIWNLNKEGARYNIARSRLMKSFEGLDAIYVGTQFNTAIFVNTPLSATQLYNRLITRIDTNDRIFITHVDPYDHYGWLDLDVADWLKRHT